MPRRGKIITPGGIGVIGGRGAASRYLRLFPKADGPEPAPRRPSDGVDD